RAIGSEGEVARLDAALLAMREALFYECWTLKEAWLKSRSEDMSPGRLAQVETQPEALLAHADARTWSGDGFILALAANPLLALRWTGDVPVECRGWRITDAAAS